MTTPRKKKAPTRRRGAPDFRLTLERSGKDLVLRLRSASGRARFWLRLTDGELVEAGCARPRKAQAFQRSSIDFLIPVASALVHASTLPATSPDREAIVSASWGACACLLHADAELARNVLTDVTSRRHRSTGGKTRDAVKRTKDARLEFEGSAELQAMTNKGAARELSSKHRLGYDAVRAAISGWRKNIGKPRRGS